MKTINITKRRHDFNKMEFTLGNGKRIQFTSKRIAGKFIADTNRYLTKCLTILNLTYIEVFREYRLFWFISSNTNSGNRTNYTDRDQKIKAALQTADFMFDKFNNVNWGSSDIFFSFIDLRKAAVFIKEASDIMLLFHKQRNNTASYYNCQVLSDRCTAVINRLDEYEYIE